MAQIIVRNLDDKLKERLQRRAKRNGRSMEAEVREILQEAVQVKSQPQVGFGTASVEIFKGCLMEEGFPELRGYPVMPAEFEP